MISAKLNAPVVSLLAKGEWDISVLDHVLDLSAHRQNEENNPVHDEDGPEDCTYRSLLTKIPVRITKHSCKHPIDRRFRALDIRTTVAGQ